MLSAIWNLAASALLVATGVQAAQNQLQQVTGNIGTNPTNVGMFVYKPSKLANPTPRIVAIHACHGKANDYFVGTQYATLADTYGYIVIYPNSPNTFDTCWDVNTNATLTHNGGGDSTGIASMVNYAIANYKVSASHVYVTGTSSGAMMTNVMSGSFPNLFQAASLYSGVAFGCFAGPGPADTWNTQCATGMVIKTAQAWGDEVRAAYPGYTGSRPKMIVWHGTADNVLYYPNYGEEIKQWTNVFGVSQTPSTTSTNNPDSGYTKTTYGANLVGYSAAGVGHTVPVHESIDLAWFGITGTTGSSSTVSSTTSHSTTTTAPPPPPSTTSPSSGGTVPHYGQCGGQGWTGGTKCVAPYTCTVSNPYYSQCL